MPCEVRFVRLPSSSGRLIRASITDITERKRSDAIAAGERRVFEKIAANAPLSSVLEAICEVIERAMAGGCCAINLFDPERQVLSFGAAPSLPRAFVAAMDRTPIGIRFGSCAAAVYLSRQVTVADIETDALWEFRREAAAHARTARRLVRAHSRLGRARFSGPSPSTSANQACLARATTSSCRA